MENYCSTTSPSGKTSGNDRWNSNSEVSNGCGQWYKYITIVARLLSDIYVPYSSPPLSHTLSLAVCLSFSFFFVEFNVGKYKIKIERERTKHTGVHIWRADRKKYKEKQTEDQQTRSHRVAVWRAQPFVFGQRQSRHERGGFDRIFSRFLNIAAASSTRTHTHTHSANARMRST